MKRSAELALIRLLRRHDTKGTYDAVGKALRTASEETRARVICSIGDTNSAHGMRLLTGLLGRWSDLDLAVVSAIAHLPGVVPAEEVVPTLRELLSTDDSELRRETVTALGAFQDAESVEILIGLLKEDSGGLRGNAHWALRQISGLEFPADVDRWSLWYADETSWWEKEGKRLLEILETGTTAEILAALRDISDRRLFRDRFVPLLESLLEHEDPAVRSSAKAVLAGFGLAQGGGSMDATAALEAHGFYPVPEGFDPDAPIAKVEEAQPQSRSLVPIVGLGILLALFLRIFGLSLLYRLRKMLSSGEAKRADGPMTIKLKPRPERGRSRSRTLQRK
jgi:hypothetical protein